MKPLKSAYLLPSVLVYQAHWNEITELVLLPLVIIKSVTLDLCQTIS